LSNLSFRRSIATGASALVLAALFAGPACASATDAADTATTTAAAAADADTGAGDIVVTAQHRSERLQDVPSAVTALGKDLFRSQDIGKGTAADVLTQTPNASSGTTQHSRPRWWIRGIGAGQQQIDLASPVGFYLDDVYISDANATGLPLFDVQQVEILRGPQGTLWGKNTTGGAINVISQRPTFAEDQDNYVKLEYGSYDDKLAEGGIGAVIVPDKLAARVSFHLDDSDGRFHNLYTGQKGNGITEDDVRVQVLAKPTANLDALLSFHYRKYDTRGDLWTTASYAANGVYRNGYVPSTNINDINENSAVYTNNRQIGGNLHLDYHLGGGTTLNAISGYERFDTAASADTDYTPLEVSQSYVKAYSSQFTQEVRLTSPQSGKLTWIVGGFYFNEKIHSDSYSADLPAGSVPASGYVGAPSYSVIDFEHKAESGAAFGSSTYNFTDALKLTGGLRWSRETKTLEFSRGASLVPSWSNYSQWWNHYTGTFGTTSTFANDLKKTWDALTYDVTPQFKIDRNNLLYFKFAHGVKSGGFNTAAAAPAALIVVAPERLNDFEGGYKSTWFDGKLTFNATVFHYDYRNVQVNVVGPNPLVAGSSVSYLQNVAKAHANGAEFEVAATPAERLTLTASAGLLYTKFDQFQVINGGANYSGNQFVRSPHLTLNGRANYTVPLAKLGKVELEADARYTSHQYYYVNVQAAQDPNRYLLGNGAYTLANARITWIAPNDRVSASVFVNNFLNTVYVNHALPAFTASSVGSVSGTSPAATSSLVYGDQVQYGDPRTWGVSLIYHF
jgi:iron complex outermembrane receptor protein